MKSTISKLILATPLVFGIATAAHADAATTTTSATNNAMKHINKRMLPNHNCQPNIIHHQN